jgi:hypothetical protein
MPDGSRASGEGAGALSLRLLRSVASVARIDRRGSERSLRVQTCALFVFLASQGTACGPAAGDAATTDGRTARPADSTVRPQAGRPGYVVDSILAPEEELRRFRAGTTEISTLSEGMPSRDGLVREFVRAVESSDTAALGRIAVSSAEFGWLIYPSSEYTKPPMRQAPEIVWLLRTNESDQGLRRVLERHGGQPLRYLRHTCNTAPTTQGQNRFWTGCVLHSRSEAGPVVRQRLFGTLVERDGVWKVLSYANQY